MDIAMKNPLLPLLFAAIILFIFVIPDIEDAVQTIGHHSWQRMNAQITAISIKELERSVAKKSLRTRIVYSYTVNGSLYTGNDIENDRETLPASSDTLSFFSQKQQKYPVGALIGIQVNPEQPAQSFIPLFHERKLYSAIMGSVAAFVLLFLAFRAYRKGLVSR